MGRNYIYSLRFICCLSNLLWTQIWHKYSEHFLELHCNFSIYTKGFFQMRFDVMYGCFFVGICWNFCFHINFYCLAIIYFNLPIIIEEIKDFFPNSPFLNLGARWRRVGSKRFEDSGRSSPIKKIKVFSPSLTDTKDCLKYSS